MGEATSDSTCGPLVLCWYRDLRTLGWRARLTLAEPPPRPPRRRSVGQRGEPGESRVSSSQDGSPFPLVSAQTWQRMGRGG